jgi:predicted MFS family arabinose efflux permease
LDFRLILLAFGAFAGTTESSLLPGLMPQIGSTMDVTVAQSGYMIVVYSIAYAVAAPILSSLLGAADRRRTLAIAELIVGLCALVIALAPTFPLMVAARAVLGCGAVLFTSMAQSTAYAAVRADQRPLGLADRLWARRYTRGDLGAADLVQAATRDCRRTPLDQ